MGYYIETDSNKNKAEWIVKHAGGMRCPLNLLAAKATSDLIPVVVVDNGIFEAAGIAFNKRELEAFTQPDDPRPKEYLLVPRANILEQNPSVEHALNW